jgi:hypothetical protein
MVHPGTRETRGTNLIDSLMGIATQTPALAGVCCFRVPRHTQEAQLEALAEHGVLVAIDTEPYLRQNA